MPTVLVVKMFNSKEKENSRLRLEWNLDLTFTHYAHIENSRLKESKNVSNVVPGD